MGEKKHEGRYTIQFNLQDVQQRIASGILEKQGRHKAQFLASVILHYEHCAETPKLYRGTKIDDKELERRIIEILQRCGMNGHQESAETPSLLSQQDSIVSEKTVQEMPMDQAAICAIRSTLLAFDQE